MISNLIRAVTVNATTGKREVLLVVVASGHVEAGDLEGVSRAVGGTALFSASARPQAAVFSQKVYFVDGVGKPKVLDLSTKTIIAFTETVTNPVNTAPSNCRLCCPWRGRLVLAAPDASPQDFFMSRVGDPHDWNYAASDEAGAVSGNASVAGRIGDRITALIPFKDDALLLGGDQSLMLIQGDLRSNGQIVQVSDQVGVLGPDAWTQDPAGNIYFVGTGGLFRIQADGTSPQNLSAARINAHFKELSRAGYHIELEWDRDRHGLWIFSTVDGEEPSVHLWYDARTEGFFPMQFPIGHGPTASLTFDGDAPDDRLLLLGGRDNIVRHLNEDANDDDGDPIVWNYFVGPIRPAGSMGEAKMLELEATLGDDPDLSPDLFRADWAIRVAEDPHSALENPADEITGVWTSPGRQDNQRARISGRTFMFRVSGQNVGTAFSAESISARFAPAGRSR